MLNDLRIFFLERIAKVSACLKIPERVEDHSLSSRR
jgi:hypothetical protein